ncbi:chromate transporter [Paenibacillus sp. J22TS3]|uniref:chromate transporter n=1 Tax=Paenibacillus sp. J22TS3 TaxID=2807192 RepID=UPI001B151893|nr:chromate transporter [Paenibacillus sp. J22TS3]GIP23673.1 chromate transporter [Paenibacillus sp. J22TS3]
MYKKDRGEAVRGKGRGGALFEVLLVSVKLGLTSFGGPIAHLGYFHNEYVQKRKWMDERNYADLVALCQFLPGPASSQVGIGIGLIRTGLLGGIVAWLGFTLPSVIALVFFALLLQGMDISQAGWIHGLKITALAIVAHAVLGMGQKLAPDAKRATIAAVAASVVLLWQNPFSQVAVIAAAGLAGFWLYREDSQGEKTHQLKVPISRRAGAGCLVLLFILLVALPLLRTAIASPALALFDSFFRSGALVFGGGHVVLPLLEQEIVGSGWVSKSVFLAGYGAAQAVPGPLFTFASYLGMMAYGLGGVVIATVGIFLPAFLLVIGALPFWSTLRGNPRAQAALIGVNAAVVGILAAAFYNPLWTSTVREPVDFVLAMILFVMLNFWKCPPWVIVLTGAAGGALTAAA